MWIFMLCFILGVGVSDAAAIDYLEGGPLLTCPTDSSVKLSFTLTETCDVMLFYGVSIEDYVALGPWVAIPLGSYTYPISGLSSDTEYLYTIAVQPYGKTDNREWFFYPIKSFHTARPRGSSFSFSLMADSHILQEERWNNHRASDLFFNTIENVNACGSDFHFSLGDIAMTEGFWIGGPTQTVEEAKIRYGCVRRHLADLEAPFFLAMGNHEGEQGWYWGVDPIAESSFHARKLLTPMPVPGDFYGGNSDLLNGHFREDYYSWEWGDALFVVLDPYHYTMTKPHSNGGAPYNDDPWLWTLGQEQYEWLYQTLSTSTAKWKFLFTHHLTSSTQGDFKGTSYGRGGIEVAKWPVANYATHEWGGEDITGSDVYSVKRPGWNFGTIHDLCKTYGVDVVFHGHDHFYARQELDGIVYLLVPRPCDDEYSIPPKFIEAGLYTHGTILPSSGHVKVSVSPDEVHLEYVRSYLPGEGNNGEVSDECFLN